MDITERDFIMLTKRQRIVSLAATSIKGILPPGIRNLPRVLEELELLERLGEPTTSSIHIITGPTSRLTVDASIFFDRKTPHIDIGWPTSQWTVPEACVYRALIDRMVDFAVQAQAYLDELK